MTPQFLVLLGTILVAGSAAASDEKEGVGVLLAMVAGVLFGLAIGSKWLW